MNRGKVKGMLSTLLNHDSGPFYVKVETEALDSEKLEILVSHGVNKGVEGAVSFTANLDRDQIDTLSDYDWITTLTTR